MKYIFILIAVCFMLPWISCNKEESTLTDTEIKNVTGHNIKISPYKNGSVVNAEVKIIANNRTEQVLRHSMRGKGAGLSYAMSLQPFDSVIVLYDDSIQAVHYSFNRAGSNPKAIRFDSRRNLLVASNYTYEVLNETKRSIHNKYTYTFTVQDYLEAK